MKSGSQLKPRDRIVTTAAQLFYDHGINPVGVAQISDVANVSKRTLYKYFETKEGLVTAAMSLLGEAWFNDYTHSPSDDPRDRIRYVFTLFEQVAENEDFYGCIFMNTSIELRGTKLPAIETVRSLKTKLYDYFEQQAERMHIKEPRVLAEQLVLLYDGCSAWIVMHHHFPTSVHRSLSLLLGSDDS